MINNNLGDELLREALDFLGGLEDRDEDYDFVYEGWEAIEKFHERATIYLYEQLNNKLRGERS